MQHRHQPLIASAVGITSLFITAPAARGAAGLPAPNKTVIVIEENHSYSEIVGYSGAPYINGLATGGANMTQSFAVTHPSQPNYLALFSGSTQGVTTDNVPSGTPYSTANLGAELRAAGKSFVGYSQTMPSEGYNGATFTTVAGQNQYVRKHNPWVNWQDNTVPTPPNRLPQSANQPFTSFPAGPDFSSLPTVSIVVPNEQCDMHDGSIATGDSWLSTNLNAYKSWATNNNALLIVTFDEDDSSASNQIPTIFWGPMVKPGNFAQSMNHYNLLRTIEDMYDLPTHAGLAATATPITNIWVPEPTSAALVAGLAWSLKRPRRSQR